MDIDIDKINTDEPVKPREEKKIDEQKMESQINWIILICILSIIALFAVYALVQRGQTITWEDYQFHKAQVGKNTGWETNLTLVKNGGRVYVPIFFRNSPIELDKIPANASGKIYSKGIVAVSPEMFNCSSASSVVVSGTILAQFLAVLGMKVEAAVTGPVEGYSESQIKNCSDANEKTVIILKKSEKNETRVYPDPENNDCYIIEVSDCNSMQGVERYITAKISDLKEMSKKLAISNKENNSFNNSMISSGNFSWLNNSSQ